MTIRIYPSLLQGQPIESHEWHGTLAAWMESKGVEWLGREQQPVAVSVNGDALPVEQWAQRQLLASDDVEIRLVPHGGVFKGIANIIGKVFNLVFGWLMPGSGGDDYQNPGQGRQLNAAEGRANTAKLNEVVPELFGRFRRFPDYLTPPRRYFVDRRAQWLEFHACIGPGRYQIDAGDVKVGDTPFASLGEDGQVQIFQPGEDLSGVSTHEHWHTVEEVGGTSSGTAGLELSTEVGNRENTDPAAYSLDGMTISRIEGNFPSGWGGGTVVTIAVPLAYVVALEPAPSRNRITGQFRHCLPLPDNAAIYLNGVGRYAILDSSLDSAGNGWIELYQHVDEFNEPIPTNNLPTGSQVMEFSHPDGLQNGYRIDMSSESEIQVTRIDIDGAASPGWEGFPTAQSSGSIAYKSGEAYGEWSSEFVACPGSEVSDTYEIDFFAPGGLAYIHDDGGLDGRSVELEIQYRNAGGGPATTIRRVYTDSTLDQIGFTERLSVPAMRAAFRVRRVSAESTETNIRDTIHWYGLKSRLRTRTSYPRWTTMSVRLRSGGRLAAQSENQINVVAQRILPVLQGDGQWGADQPTRDISAAFRYIAQSIGYTDANIEMGELQRLHGIWQGRGDTFDHVFDLTTVKDAMNSVLGAGMSELTVSDGRIRPVRDEPRAQFEHAYSPQNMTGPLRRTFRARRHDDPDGVEVEYTDGETWTQQTVICALPGSPQTKLEKIKLIGVTDRVRAWRIGMRRARQHRYRNWDYSFGTELDALNSEYLSYVPLFDDIPGYGQSALLTGIEPHAGGALLRVSEPLRWEEGAAHIVGYRRPDGTLAGPWTATPGPDDFTIIAPIPQPWPAVTLKQELPHVYFGVSERWCFPALITDIKPSGTASASVSATNYAAEVYESDNAFPPN